MERHFNLIKNELGTHEKRVLPRFPFCYLTFKAKSNGQLVYEVKDISYTGMQLSLKNGTHSYKEDETLSGSVHWHGQTLELTGKVVWLTQSRLGVEFNKTEKQTKEVKNFLSVKNIVTNFRPIHKSNIGLEIPAKLKYWLRGDGPMEIFVWQHAGGALSTFQILLMENFVEWEDGVGLKTGRALSKRNLDTPLLTEDEYVFLMDQSPAAERLNFAMDIVKDISDDSLSTETLDFIKRKLSSH
ncbi:MAG: PilZ domain-containing protein [Bacteriovoracaceae bacterium]